MRPVGFLSRVDAHPRAAGRSVGHRHPRPSGLHWPSEDPADGSLLLASFSPISMSGRGLQEETEGQFFYSHLQWRGVLGPSSVPFLGVIQDMYLGDTGIDPLSRTDQS